MIHVVQHRIAIVTINEDEAVDHDRQETDGDVIEDVDHRDRDHVHHDLDHEVVVDHRAPTVAEAPVSATVAKTRNVRRKRTRKRNMNAKDDEKGYRISKKNI